MERLHPSFPLSVGFGPVFFPTKRRLHSCRVQGLMFPGYAFQLFILHESHFPHHLEDTKVDPFLVVVVDCAAGGEHSWNRIPLAAGSHFVKDGICNRLQLFNSGSATSPSRPRPYWKEQFHSAPEHLRHSISIKTIPHDNLNGTQSQQEKNGEEYQTYL